MKRFAIAAAFSLLIALPARAALSQVVPTGFVDELRTGGLSQPVGLAFLPDGRLLFVEQTLARVRMLDGGVVTTMGTLSGVSTGGERGLLGIAVDPRWPAFPYIYFHLTQLPSAGTVRIVRYTANGDLAATGNRLLALDLTSRYELLSDAPNAASNHNGGTVRFGPDGMLYASFGEDAQPCAAQDTVSLRGVLLRLDVTRLPAGAGIAPRALITPADNPFVAASPDSDARLVWAFGLRNPFRFAIDPANGDLVISDVGQNRWEEVDLADQPGMNFGWPLREGPVSNIACAGRPATGYAEPIFSYDRVAAGGGSAVAITAGVYRAPSGAATPFGAEYAGDIFVSDYYSGYLWRLKRSGDTWAIASPVTGQPEAEHWARVPPHVSDYSIGPDGALWYCRQSSEDFASNTGEIRRIVPSDDPPPPPPPVLAIGAARPVPSAGAIHFAITLDRAARVGISVIDARGRRVRLVQPDQQWSSGPGTVNWDGLDDQGRDAPSGLYFIRVTVDGRAFVRRAVVVK